VVPGRYDITIYQRATFTKDVILPIDITGHEVFAQIWDEKRRNKVADFEVTVIDAVDGHIRLTIDWQDTTPLKKPAFWDLMVVYNDDTRDYWLEGAVTIDPGLTAKEDA
jgi:hypothetical protein